MTLGDKFQIRDIFAQCIVKAWTQQTTDVVHAKSSHKIKEQLDKFMTEKSIKCY